MAWILHGLVAVLAARACIFFARYILGLGGTQRFHVESAATLFVALGILSMVSRARRIPQTPLAANERLNAAPWWSWGLFCALSLALYWPAIQVGFLSDDYVLTERALRGDLTAFNTQGFRPVPLLIWSLLLRAGAGARGLHLLNILLHGTNAFLVSQVVRGLIPGRTASPVAGLIVLVSPLAPEAVVWCSGLFDLTATTFGLVSILACRRCVDHRRWMYGLLFVASATVAILCKETAVIVPGLVALDAWSRRALSKRLVIGLGLLSSALAVYGVVRVVAAPGGRVPISAFMLQRYLFSIFGSSASPWHVEVAQWQPSIPILYGAFLLSIAASFFIRPATAQSVRIAGMAAGWMLLGALPTFTFLVVLPDLQGARYMYFPTVGWAILLAVGTHDVGTGLRGRVQLLAVGVMLALSTVGVRRHLEPWQGAAAERTRIEQAARTNPDLTQCHAVTLDGLPDSNAGAYVFRNGAEVAFARDAGLVVSAGPALDSPCSFHWTGTAFVRAFARK